MELDKPKEETQFKAVAYDSYVVLPILKGLFLRLADGNIDRRALNKSIVLYATLPNSVQKEIDVKGIFGKSLKKLKNGSNSLEVKKKTLLKFVSVMKRELEKKGLLRDSRTVRKGKV